MATAQVRAAGSSSSTSPSFLADLASSLPLTWPVPNPSTDPSLIPSSDIALEQDLLLNQESMRSWRYYISHIEDQNYCKRAPPDIRCTPEEARLLGPLASADNRVALRRIVSIYERALARFPNSYSLHRDYLFARARFVLGEPKGGFESLRKRINQTTKRTLEVGPGLLPTEDQCHDEWQWVWQTGGALDGTVGYKEWVALVAACERSLRWIPMLPRLHLFYLSIFLHPLCPAPLRLTHARRTFDRSLRLLPPSLHLRVWKVYLQWAEKVGGETGLRVWRRYLRVDPSLTERYVRLLLATRPSSAKKTTEEEAETDERESSPGLRALEAAKLLLGLATNALGGTYVSPEAKSPHQLFSEWLELVDRYPEETGLDEDDEAKILPSEVRIPRPQDVDSLNSSLLPVRNIVLATMPRYPDQGGKLWVGLATYHLKRGEIELARRTFCSGMESVVTVRDFSIIFDAYAESEEGVISYLMNEVEEAGEETDEDTEGKELDLDQRIKDFEKLIENRPFLVNDVMLRRNPNDVQEWQKRVALFGNQDDKVIETYRRAIETIQPHKATANHHQLFLNFARFHELGGSVGIELFNELQRGASLPVDDAALPMPNLAAARQVFERAVAVPYRRIDDLAEVWISWAEMELRHGKFDAALRVMSRSVHPPRQIKGVSYYDDSLPPQSRLFKSLKLWSFYSDLEESIGSTEGAKRVYDCILELKIANAQTIINYASFLEERNYHEDAFTVYERGVELFEYPIAFEIWNIYLSKFVARYGGLKIERARDLFEQALAGCPAKFSKILYLKYGALEEEHGLAKRAMRIYERATRQVSDEERFDMFAFYIAKTASNFGLAATRAIYESAIEVLPDRQTAEMCLRFAALERKLGEIDRSRAIYKYASQFCDPRTHANFWKEWNAFEIETGSEDTFREMLRIRRSVQAQYNTDLSYISASIQKAVVSAQSNGSAADGGGGGEAAGMVGAADAGDPMAQLEANQGVSSRVAATSMFVSARTNRGSGKVGSAEKDGDEDGDAVSDGEKNSERVDVGGDDDEDDLM